MGACFSCCVSDEGPDASAYRAGSSLRYVRPRLQTMLLEGPPNALSRTHSTNPDDQVVSTHSTSPGFPWSRTPGVQTEADRAARAAAAEAAAARQERFETSAVGKAVKKSVKASKERPAAGRESTTISDYIS